MTQLLRYSVKKLLKKKICPKRVKYLNYDQCACGKFYVESWNLFLFFLNLKIILCTLLQKW